MVHKKIVNFHCQITFKEANIYALVQSHETHSSKIWFENTFNVKRQA